MGGESWSLTAKPCDSCKTASASVFCRADSAFLCIGCDSKVHAANKLASRHARVLLCEVCEQAPASVTCKADAAALCASCDRDIHSANPLARRHERLPVIPFFDSVSVAKCTGAAEEAEAASWLLPTPNCNKELEPESPEYKTADYLFNDLDHPYLELDLDQKPQINDQYHHHHNCDGVVPVQSKNESNHSSDLQGPVVDGYPTYALDYAGSKPLLYNFSSQSISQSVSSSSMEVGVVPDHNAMADVSNTLLRTEGIPNPVSGLDREARVLRYREKRKNRKFEKTIRYASRKAYAETRPRIKGRFAKRSEVEVESFIAAEAEASYGVVPTY